MHSNAFTTAELNIDAIEKIITSPLLKKAKIIALSGNFGDPIYHSQFSQIIEMLKKYSKNISLVTNGSGRTKEWWEKLTPYFSKKDKITFSIDGLHDTNHLYRFGSQWDSILNAISTVRKSTIRMVWKFIVFRHNENQIIETKKFAKNLGFNEFELIKSNRFGSYYTKNNKPDPLEPRTEFLSQKLLASRSSNKKGPTQTTRKKIIPKCKYSSLHFFSSTGHYYPCPSAAINLENKKNDFWKNPDDFDIHKNNLEAIFKNQEFQNFLRMRSSYETAHATCQQFCGISKQQKELDTINKKRIPLIQKFPFSIAQSRFDSKIRT